MTNLSTIIVFAVAIAIVNYLDMGAVTALGWLALLAFSSWILCWMRRPI